MIELSKLLIENLNYKEILITRSDISLLQQIFESGQDWMSACGGKGRCITCRIEVLEGMQNLTPLTEQEVRFRAEKRFKDNERLTCQIKLNGFLKVRIPKSCQLPHISYS